MKNFILFALMYLPFVLTAQNKEGTITFEEVIKLKIELSPEMQQYASMIPSEHKTLKTLAFKDQESLYTAGPDEADDAEKAAADNSGVVVQTIVVGGAGGESKTYSNFAKDEKIQLEDLMGQKFLVTGTPRKYDWKVTGEQKKILDFTCIKAEAVRDSSLVTAWFTPEIPTSIGPAVYCGLPGAILAIETKRGENKLHITATEVNLAALDTPIRKPKKGKKVTEEEFDEIMEKRMEEMARMRGAHRSQNGNMSIQISTN